MATGRPSRSRIAVGFWLLGLINNVLYVIILSAALDLVGPTIPKGTVLLADVFPSFLVKFIAPYFIHVVPYRIRVICFVLTSASGMFLIALSPGYEDAGSITVKLLGVAIASLSSGGGELSFLGLTHYYGHLAVASWSSGTGAAGLIGAGAYALATTTLGLSSKTSLLSFAFLPLIMLYSFFVVLPPRAVDTPRSSHEEYQTIDQDESSAEDGIRQAMQQQEEGLNSNASQSLLGKDSKHSGLGLRIWTRFKANLLRAKGLFIPYMLPLLIVYVAEYTINQGVAPTLLFKLNTTPFEHFREFYPAYATIYQLGVFISRSSSAFIRIPYLYPPSLFQVMNLAVLTAHSLFGFLPNVWVVFVIIFWEGLLGGLVYVNTFSEITDNVPLDDREFSLTATTVSDSGGICIAALIGMALEPALCNWQVSRGQDWCRRL